MRRLVAIVSGSMALVLVGCGGGGGGGEDTATDTTSDTTDTGGDTGDAPADTAGDDATAEVECSSDGDCDDSDPCTADSCDLDYDECRHEAVDADEDGYPAEDVGGTACTGGTDCDDADADVHPDATSDCTGAVDANCTGEDDRDEDGDGYTTVACTGGDDCDDSDGTAFPGSLAIDCSAADHDCNGQGDEDNDGDGQEATSCGGNDCDDADPAIRWGIAEVDCDGVDTNCDGTLSVIEDADADDSPNAACAPAGVEPDCDDGDYDIHPGAAEACDLVDDDCDGEWADAPGADDDGDGFLDITCGGVDCDDTDPAANPDDPDDACDLVDRDCDGVIEEHIDDDGDGWIDEACDGLMTDHGTYHGFGDCNDLDDSVNPEVTTPDVCDGIDRNCNGIDDDTGSCGPGRACSGPAECDIAWVTVSAGTFTMGSPGTEPGHESDETEHQVTLTHSFEMQATEVTQDQFFAVMGYQTACNTSCGGGCPVECITWHEAAAYTNALSTAAGYGQCYTCSGSGTGVSCSPSAAYATPYDCPGYRLPTEAEWEFAARAGTTGGTYNGTSTLTGCENPNTVLDPIAWFCGNAGDTIHVVGGKTSNAWEMYDMLGNVWEWCGDWYGTYPGDVTNPWGPGTGSNRVLRGGSWVSSAGVARAANRDDFIPGLVLIGFRPARSW